VSALRLLTIQVTADGALRASRAPWRSLHCLCQMVLLLSVKSLLQNVWGFFIVERSTSYITLKASALTDEGSM